jgi:energy-coupling factor transporter ATP-binding protein EcfA2
MPNWDEAVNRVNVSQHFDLPKKGHFSLLRKKCCVAITGASGAGKTELFRYLTGKNIPNKMSLNSDEGRQKFKNQNKSLSLLTVPGQPSRERKELMDYLFGDEAKLDGIIHVCSHGFNEVWSENQMHFLLGLKDKSLNGIRNKNLINEYGDFKEIIEKITDKMLKTSKELHPKWFLILVSKADLYWNTVSSTRSYYHPLDTSSNNKFKSALSNFISQFAERTGIKVIVLPIALTEQSYVLKGIDLDIHCDSKMDEQQRVDLNSVFFDILERYSNAII